MHSDTDPLACDAWSTRLREKLRGRAARGVKRLVRPALLRSLAATNLEASTPVVMAGGPVVSLTTHGQRLGNVHFTLESIARGDLRPSRLVLWLDRELARAGLPAPLQRLVARGLEVRTTRDLGPHTKYFPQVLSEPEPSVALATADDDILYPRYWLAALQEHALRHPGSIVCFRAHEVVLTEGRQLAPYGEWRGCRTTQPHHRHFLTGVSGVLHPPSMQHALRQAGNGFLQRCPRADDIWLNCVALRSGHPVAQVRSLGRRFFELPGTREHGLARSNVRGGGNDRQLAATYTAQDLARLASGWGAAAAMAPQDAPGPAAGRTAQPAVPGGVS